MVGSEAESWKLVNKQNFHVPPPVGARSGEDGKRMVFPNVHPVAPLVRINVLEAQEPMRHKISVPLGNPGDEANEYWHPVFAFYAFADEMPYTQPFTIEKRREPYGNRVKQEKNPQARDLTKWENLEPIMGFHAYPEPLPQSSEFSLDWSSGPDRYMVSQLPRPQLGWLRCSRWFGFQAAKYHVCQAEIVHDRRPTICYRIINEFSMPLEEGWKCIFAFYAFTEQLQGTSKYFVQEQFEPHQRLRVAAEPTFTKGWLDACTFCAWDVPMPGTTRLSVQYLAASAETRTQVVAQSRIHYRDPYDPWLHKSFFYAYPAPTLHFG